MVLVDSTVWIDYFNGNNTPESDKLDNLLCITDVCIGDLILTEVLQGFKHDKEYKMAKKLFDNLTTLTLVGPFIAIKTAENFRYLRKKGITIRKTIDSIIATYCIENGIPLLHSDKDFSPFHKHLGLLNALYLT